MLCNAKEQEGTSVRIIPCYSVFLFTDADFPSMDVKNERARM